MSETSPSLSLIVIVPEYIMLSIDFTKSVYSPIWINPPSATVKSQENEAVSNLCRSLLIASISTECKDFIRLPSVSSIHTAKGFTTVSDWCSYSKVMVNTLDSRKDMLSPAQAVNVMSRNAVIVIVISFRPLINLFPHSAQ